jgi:hypothetical protein
MHQPFESIVHSYNVTADCRIELGYIVVDIFNCVGFCNGYETFVLTVSNSLTVLPPWQFRFFALSVITQSVSCRDVVFKGIFQ